MKYLQIFLMACIGSSAIISGFNHQWPQMGCNILWFASATCFLISNRQTAKLTDNLEERSKSIAENYYRLGYEMGKASLVTPTKTVEVRNEA